MYQQQQQQKIKSWTKQVIQTGSDNLTSRAYNEAEACFECWIEHNTALHWESQQTANTTSIMQRQRTG